MQWVGANATGSLLNPRVRRTVTRRGPVTCHSRIASRTRLEPRLCRAMAVRGGKTPHESYMAQPSRGEMQRGF